MPVDPTNNISGFVEAFAGGGVRNNLFKVTGQIPGYANNDRAISFLIKAAQIPASSLGTIEVPYRGRRIKLPGAAAELAQPVGGGPAIGGGVGCSNFRIGGQPAINDTSTESPIVKFEDPTPIR